MLIVHMSFEVPLVTDFHGAVRTLVLLLFMRHHMPGIIVANGKAFAAHFTLVSLLLEVIPLVTAGFSH